MRMVVLVLVFCLSPWPARALEPEVHYDLTLGACEDAGLGAQFCTRVAMAAHNVDALEWDRMSAHAQRDPEEGLEDAAAATLDRLEHLGTRAREALQDLGDPAGDPDLPQRLGLAADALGRALHTLQDVCTHHGMSNPEHAWYSRLDLCEQWSTSPDVDPEAKRCGGEQTDAFFVSLRADLTDLAVPLERLEDVRAPFGRAYPAAGALCSYLASSTMWNGQDLRWRDDLMVPASRKSLEAGVQGLPRPATPRAGLQADPEDSVETDPPPYSCEAMALLCPPGLDQPLLTGCSASGPAPWAGLVLVALLRRRTSTRVR